MSQQISQRKGWRMSKEEASLPARTFPSIGDIIALKASDYFNGTNDLSLRLVHLPDELARIPSLEWAQVIGVEVLGTEGCGPQRIFVVRVEALKTGPRETRTMTNTE